MFNKEFNINTFCVTAYKQNYIEILLNECLFTHYDVRGLIYNLYNTDTNPF